MASADRQTVAIKSKYCGSEFYFPFAGDSEAIKLSPQYVAIKVHRSREAYERERDVYLRLKEAGVEEILGFAVPKLIRFDDELLVIEMTIVTRPFVLDFAGAYLNQPPQFSDEIWSEWEAEKRDQFENRWPEVQAVLSALEAMDIYMVDVSPSNIAFLD